MSEMVDWGLAARVADLVAGDDDPKPELGPLREAVADSATAVQSYTGLEPRQPLPEPEWVTRREWAAVNLDALREGIAPLERRAIGGPGLPGPLRGAVSGTLGLVAGAQIGALVGYASRRVLGQYEFALLGAERPPRLLFVAANIDAAGSELGGEPPVVLRWIALHEVTHAVHLGAAPWLRAHLRSLALELIESSRIGIGREELAAVLKDLRGSDPRALLRALRGTDPLTLLTPASSRPALAQAQASMASIEGYAEHVMDAAAPALGEDVRGLRAAMDRRREHRPPLARLLSWLLGIELKLRQYRDGKRFCDEVVAREGVAALNRAWSAPERLPRLQELADAGAWLERTAPARV